MATAAVASTVIHTSDQVRRQAERVTGREISPDTLRRWASRHPTLGAMVSGRRLYSAEDAAQLVELYRLGQ